jgi:CheY-like chemotaxis protein
MKKAFCPACGIEVDVVHITVGMGVHAEEKPRCVLCGFNLETAGCVSAERLFERVAIVEDMAPVRRAVREELLQQGLVESVDEYDDGSGFVKALQAGAGQGPLYDLVILDLNMPVINGLKAATFMRSLENRSGWKPVPILFFSAVVCDERLQLHLTNLGPAVYLNKASIEERSDLPDRLRSILSALKN